MSTDLAVVLIVGLAMGWEVYTLANKKLGDTISETIWKATIKQPLIPFLAGLLMGHFFWLPRKCWELLE